MGPTRQSVFQRNIRLGFAVSLFVAVFITVGSFIAIQSVRQSANVVTFNRAEDLFETDELVVLFEAMSANARAYLLTGNRDFLEKREKEVARFRATLGRLSKALNDENDVALIQKLQTSSEEYFRRTNETIALREKGAPPNEIIRMVEQGTTGIRHDVETRLDTLSKDKENAYFHARDQAARAALRSLTIFILLAVVAISLSTALAILLSRTLLRLFRRSEEALEERNRAVQMRDEIVAFVSHELKNPLSAVMTNIQLIPKLLEKNAEPPRLQDSIDRIEISVKRMSRLTADLLDISKIEAGRLVMDFAACAPESMIDETTEFFCPLASDKGIRIKDEVFVELPQVLCDRGRVLQVFSNLISNAIKFTPPGGIISVGAKPLNSDVLFWVRDTGQGIPEKDLERIFDRFWQARQTASLGTGLGLSIARALITRHGGKIWAESVVGAGTTFYFTLKTAQVGLPENPAIAS